jgi:uncharacterized protein YuzE
MKLHIQIDKGNDQIYLGFGRPQRGRVARTVEVSRDIFADIDGDGRLVGIDIADASRAIGDGDLQHVTIETLAGVKEAAALFGLQKSNFVRDFSSREDFPAPVAELASGRVWLRSQLEAYRDRVTPGRRKTAPA